jgi:hypothetical protein
MVALAGEVVPLRTIRGWCTTLTLTWALAAVPGVAVAQGLTEAQVAEALSGYEDAPTAQELQAWGPTGALHLMQLGASETALPQVRVRAVYALRVFPALPGVRDYLRAIAEDGAAGLFLRRAAMDALVEGLGDVLRVAGLFRNPRADVRDGVAWALSRSTSPTARALLSARLRVEPDETVRGTLRQVLQRAL